MQRIDLPALRDTLLKSDRPGLPRAEPRDFLKLSLLEQNLLGNAGAGAADELLSGMLTPDKIAELLAKGRFGPSSSGGEGAHWRMPPLIEAFGRESLQVLAQSRFDGPLSFVVGLDSAQGRYGVHLHLSGTTWRLSGLDVPETVSAELARAIAGRVAGGPK